MTVLTLRKKIIAGSVALILLMGTTLFLVIGAEIHNRLEDEIQKRGAAIARHLADASTTHILTENSVGLQLLVNSYLKNEEDLRYIYIVTNKKDVLAHTFGKTFPADLLEMPDTVADRAKNRSTALRSEEGLIYDIPALIQQGRLGAVHIGISESAVHKSQNDILQHITFYLAAVLFLGIIIAFWFATTITRPIAALAEGVRKVGMGELDCLIETNSQDEIGQLSAAFNAMTENLRNEVEERKQVAEELLVARDTAEAASQSKSEFLANMSHEIRTPLTAIIGGAEYLEESVLSADQSSCIDMIHQAGNNLLVLTSDLIDLARIEAGHLELLPERFNVAAMMKSIIQMLSRTAQGKGLELSLNMADNLPEFLLGDQLRLQQVLVNLVGNAIKFTAEGSVQVSTTVGSIVDDVVPITFVVRDTGIGIEPGKIDKIFETFTQADSSITRQYGGSGLGLTISRRLVEAMGGHLKVESKLGVGSSFYFTLRLRLMKEDGNHDEVEKPNGMDEKNSHVISRTGEGNALPLVLLVDDALENRELIRLQLKKKPIVLHEAVNGSEALDMFEQNEYVLILMDIQMPIMDGYTATRLMRDFEQRTGRAKTPIVALTAHLSDTDVHADIEAGFDDHIAKPFKKEALYRCLERYLDERQNA